MIVLLNERAKEMAIDIKKAKEAALDYEATKKRVDQFIPSITPKKNYDVDTDTPEAIVGEILDAKITDDDTSELAIIGQQNDLQVSKVEELLGQFTDPFLQARQLAVGYDLLVVTDENDKAGMDKARKHRLAIRQIRIDTENLRVALKEASLREGKAIDGMANIIKAIIIPAEEHYAKQEKFADDLATARKATKKAERIAELSKFMDNVFVFNLDDMDDEAYAQVLEDAKAKWQTKQDEIVAAEKAAADKKIADEAEAERLKVEADKKLADAQADAKKAADEKKIADDKAATEKARADAAEATLKAEADKKAKESADAEKLRLDALKAPDKEKLRTVYKSIATLRETLPEMQSDEAIRILDIVKSVLDKATAYIAIEAKKL